MLWRRLALTVAGLCLAACAARPGGQPSARVTASARPALTAAVPALTDTPAPATPAPLRTATASPAAATAEPTATALGPTTLGRVENFVLVGRHDLGGRGWNGGLALAGECAYIGNRRRPQVAIVDVSDPAAPSLAGELVMAPGSQPVEVRTVPDLNRLVVMNLAPGVTFITYDVTDCRNPVPLGSYSLGAVPHEFFLWRDAARPERLLAFASMYHNQRPDLHVVDLTDPAAPRWLGSWSAPAAGAAGSLHSLSVSPDGRLAYLALTEGGLLVADTSDFAAGRAQPQLRLVRDAAGFAAAPAAAAHSAVPLADPRFVLVTEEVYRCPFAGLFVADTREPARPRIISRFGLPESAPPCDGRQDPDAIFTAHNPLVVGELAFVTWHSGGLQVLDVSDPSRPVRVGVYVPDGTGAADLSYLGRHPVQMWSYPVVRAGLVYASDVQSGLHIVRYTGPGAEAVASVSLAEGNVTLLP